MISTEKIESPIERKFFEAVASRLAEKITLTPQVEIQTKRGMRRLDFLLSDGTAYVVIECDGAAFHDFDRDLNRDVALFFAGAHAIFHFSGSFIHQRSASIPGIIAHFVPEFFINTKPASHCPLPTDGAYVRLAPTFPNLRECCRDRVIDGWSAGILDCCHNLAKVPLSVAMRLILEEAARREADARMKGKK